MKFLKVLFLFLVLPLTAQQGGMWIPSLLEGMNEKEMKGLGSNLSAKDIYDVNNSSLKDAIVHFNGGCTAEIISDSGLLLTNHHCGYGAIQSHSSVDHDYLKDGFWSYAKNEELPNPGMFITLIHSITDVTNDVLKGVNNKMSAKERQSTIDKNMAKVEKKAKKESWQDAKVKSFYKGNQFFLFITITYNDIRLVGAPPSSIGKYGSDTDNWMWPRHTGDFALFRIYAGKNNLPAAYSKDNVPYKPKHFLPVSLDGVSEGDFTMVFGFPGRTNEYLPSVAIDQIVNTLNPAKIEIRENALKIMDKHMRADQKIKIQYASKYASIANYWKKWIGENQGIAKSNAIAHKKKQEEALTQKVANNDQYNQLLNQFNKLYKQSESTSLARDYWIELNYRNIGLLRSAVMLYQFENKVNKKPNSFDAERNKLLKQLEGHYKNYNAKVDQEVFAQLMKIYQEKNPNQYTPDGLKQANIDELSQSIYQHSKLTCFDCLQGLLKGNKDDVLKQLNGDKGYTLGKSMTNVYYNKISPAHNQYQTEIQAVQAVYMKALMDAFPNDRFFPDANSTLRVTYGQVKGYYPRDAVYYKPVSYLEGVLEKYKPGDYEFDLPEHLINLYNNKDYGAYAENGKMPVNFIGTNHTTGGNSGSPVIDAHGNLIGLNFDRVWEGTMSDYNYDPEICRNIMVDARYILFVIDKYANNKRLIDELKLVHPKSK